MITPSSPLPLNKPMAVNGLSTRTTPGNRMAVVDRTKVDPELVKAAEGMEAMFLDYMMKVMRETVPKNELDLESPATEIYRGMMDSEFAQRASKQGGIGLADQLIAYMEAQRYTGDVTHGAGEVNAARVTDVYKSGTASTGGTHAGQSVNK